MNNESFSLFVAQAHIYCSHSIVVLLQLKCSIYHTACACFSDRGVGVERLPSLEISKIITVII